MNDPANFGLEPPCALFYDTETTDLPLFTEKDANGKNIKGEDGKDVWVRSADPRQPHLVQIAAKLVCLATRETIDSIFMYVRPDGWTSVPAAFERHQCTDEFLLANGISEAEAVHQLLALWERATFRAAYGEKLFDARIIRIALARLEYNEATQQAWKDGTAVCVLQECRPLVKAKTGNGKSPSLAEAHRALVGHDFEDAHRADADVDAAMRVFFAVADANADGPAVLKDGVMNVY